jgi:hypothetical protein
VNNKILIGFFVALLVIVLGLPMISVAKKMAMGQTAGGASSAPVVKPPPAPPLLNSSNLVGTAWEVKTDDIPVAVTIHMNAGGQAVATVPPMFAPLARGYLGTDTLTGTWSVSGAKLTASVTVKDKTETVDCDIIGDRVFFKDIEVKRVQ